jgi:ADP-heptose:LPS heptosyltransferase
MQADGTGIAPRERASSAPRVERALRRVLIVRNDKLGDFVLALPCFAWLKRCAPEIETTALVPEYTREIAALSPAIDRVIVDPGSRYSSAGARGSSAGARGSSAGAFALARLLKREQFDAVVALYSTARVGCAAWIARIPYRLAPATKLAQVFYNDRLVQRRSRSEMPEWRYNLALAARLLARQGVDLEPELLRPVLAFDARETEELRLSFCREHALPADRPLVFVHAGSGGSASNLARSQFAELVRDLRSARGHSVVLSAGPGERVEAEELARAIAGPALAVYDSDRGLASFARHIAFADAFVSGSTGPLHLAGALDRPTAAFYPRRRSSTALRWQTLNRPDRRLAFSPPEGSDESEMSAIDVRAAAREISRHFLAAPE